MIKLGGKPISIDCVDDANISIKDFFTNSMEEEYIHKNYEQIKINNFDANG